MITNHVTDKIRSKKLAKYLPQEGGLFYWGLYDRYLENGEPKSYVSKKHWVVIFSSGFGERVETFYRAFLSTELNEWLPEVHTYFVTSWNCLCQVSGVSYGVGNADTEQNAKADMILYLVKEGIIKLGE